MNKQEAMEKFDKEVIEVNEAGVKDFVNLIKNGFREAYSQGWDDAIKNTHKKINLRNL